MNIIHKISFAVVVVGSLAASAFAGPAGGGGNSWNGSGGYSGIAGGWHDAGSGAGNFSSPGGFHNYATGNYAAPTYYTAAPQAESSRAYSYEPAPALKAGDKAVVAKATSELKIGNRVIATLPKGARISVLTVQGGWIGANVERNGKKISGWLSAGDLAAAAPGSTR